MNDLKEKGIFKERMAPVLELIGKSLFLALPFVAVFVLYLVKDPFMSLRDYKVYDSEFTLPESYVGWKIYMNNRDSAEFDSYIMGNSCTMAYRCEDWEKYLDGGKAVRLFGSSESMLTILRKLQAVENSGGKIKNVLLVLDVSSLAQTELKKGFVHMQAPEVSGLGEFRTQLEFFQSFISPEFLYVYLEYLFSGGKCGNSWRINRNGRVRNPENNDAFNPREKMIAEEGESYWLARPDEFPERDGRERFSDPVISLPQKKILHEIADLLERNSARTVVIISPDYDQIRISSEDREVLESVFGKENVFDLSGVNEFTSDYHDYYEKGHYRPCLGRRVLEFVY